MYFILLVPLSFVNIDPESSMKSCENNVSTVLLDSWAELNFLLAC
jgi:hypothetical protein